MVLGDQLVCIVPILSAFIMQKQYKYMAQLCICHIYSHLHPWVYYNEIELIIVMKSTKTRVVVMVTNARRHPYIDFVNVTA